MAKKKAPKKKKTAKKAAEKKTTTLRKKSAAGKKTKKKKERDIEKEYSNKQTISKLRRLAEALEQGKNFRIQIAGERLYVPKDAIVNLEHERENGEEEIEFQIKWKR